MASARSGRKHDLEVGVGFTSIRYGERLGEIRATPSIDTIADAYDNSLAEMVSGYYKAELIRGPAREGAAMEDRRQDRAGHLELGPLAQQRPPALLSQ